MIVTLSWFFFQVVAVAPPAGNTSTAGAVFLIVNAALGAGLLNFPAAFDQAGGVLAAVLVQAVLLLFIMVALIILAKTSDLKQSTTLQVSKSNQDQDCQDNS